MSKKFAEYTEFDLSAINKSMLEKWESNNLFQKSTTLREGGDSFVFYEGPPSANGMPGIHHVMARTIKDIFCRYKTMKGFEVKRKAGWDTHGLPVELGVEKALGITKEDIGKKVSVIEYNAACRKDVMKYTREWEDLTRKMGYWVDMSDPYITYDNRYIETLWYLLKELYKKGLLYKGYTIQPYSPAAGTGLSTHELNQPGCYRDVKDTTCVAQFKIKNPRPEWSRHGEAFFLAWTTTPWTLPSNTALCVGPAISYVAVQSYNFYTGKPATYILAKDLLAAHFSPKSANLSLDHYQAGEKSIPYKVLEQEYKGEELLGIQYEQLIPWVNPAGKAFEVISGDYVSTEEGTGIVHIAPTFGADDQFVAKKFNISPLLLIDKDGNKRPMVDSGGKFFRLEDLDPDFVRSRVNVEKYTSYAGRYVKNEYMPEGSEFETTLDVDLSVMLKQENRAFKIEKHVHNYPHCWRTDKPILYYPMDSWFIKTTACRDQMIALNQTILWKPGSTGTGRFGKWLENLQDWNLSRSRFWGTPLPIWRTDDGSEELCIGSVAELYEEIEKAVRCGFMKKNPYKNFVPGLYTAENYSVEKIDLHRPYVDEIVLVSPSGKAMKRETDLIDVWFDSGAMPYAQIHYPFENKEAFDSGQCYPADFIAEGVDQTRGWFFTLHALAAMLFDSVAFKSVVSNGLVLDKNGNKMSKRLGNAVDPFSTIEKYGSDPLRWYMITNASPWDNLKFDEEGIEEVRRKFFGTLYNTYSFFVLYANVDGFDNQAEQIPLQERPEIDRWILSQLNSLIRDTDQYYNDYEATKAGRAIADFVGENLSNWYVRLNRKRFWGGDYSKDKLSAYQTLYTCLETVSRLMAPIAPFYADRLFLDLNTKTKAEPCESVHMADYPQCRFEAIDSDLENRMQMAQQISSMVLALRRKVNIRVRQPLQTIMIPALDAAQKEAIEAVRELILNEVNVKELKFIDTAGGLLIKRIKPDFKKLGPKCGKNMKQTARILSEMQQDSIAEFEKNGYCLLKLEGQTLRVEADDVEILSEDIPGWLVANEGRLTVALDVSITEELRREGLARELVNRIQNLRKARNFEITDRIHILMEKNPAFAGTMEDWGEYISTQTLGLSLQQVEVLEDGTELDMDNMSLKIKVLKAE
ncbi:MAG: isoleucine--tRNA ligase [Bacteroidales bacterium]|nr:isoleucine--tRNA ligase [Bacteroidales bacterium]MDD4361045.1 isoleucine--tRNA ligase [Bacteroidales bacterium]